MNLKVLFVSSVLSFALIGCVSEFDAKLPLNDIQILVVNGTIEENSDVSFYLSKSFSLDTCYVPAESSDIDAKLTIIGSNGYQSKPATNIGNGEYRIYVGKLDDNVEYGIQIEYDGDTYRSTLSKPLHTPEIDSISWVQPEKEGAISFRISTHDDTEGAKFLLWNYTEDWEITAEHSTTIFMGFGPPPKGPGYYSESYPPYYYCWKKGASKKILIGSTESLKENRIINQQFYECDPADKRFSELYCITVSQRVISKEAHEYYQNKLKFQEEMGGLFTPQPFEVKGNITCTTNPSKKAIGYVETVKNISQKRIFVSREQISRPRINSDCELIRHENVSAYVPGYSINVYLDFYNMGYRPALTPNALTHKPDYWTYQSCTDCTANGGSKDKPDFWPNDHR